MKVPKSTGIAAAVGAVAGAALEAGRETFVAKKQKQPVTLSPKKIIGVAVAGALLGAAGERVVHHVRESRALSGASASNARLAAGKDPVGGAVSLRAADGSIHEGTLVTFRPGQEAGGFGRQVEGSTVHDLLVSGKRVGWLEGHAAPRTKDYVIDHLVNMSTRENELFGCGSALIGQAVEDARAAGCDRVLATATGASHGFFFKQGFRPLQGQGEFNAAEMAKALEGFDRGHGRLDPLKMVLELT